MSHKGFEDTIALLRAHGAAAGNARLKQVKVNVSFRDADMVRRGSYTVWVCMGSCRKCDRLWVELRMELASIKVVGVRRPEPAAPA